MSGESGEDALWRPAEKRIELPPPLAQEYQPSRAELETYAPRWELFLKPDLPQHGLYHGSSVLVWSNVLYNMAPEGLRGQMDKKALSIASLYHDCGRKTDYGYLTGEMQKHGPRGADVVKDNWQLVDPNLKPEQVDRVTKLIRIHTPTNQDRAAKKVDKRKIDEYDPDELELRLLQDADHADLVRGYYGRKLDSPRRTPLATLSSGARFVSEHIHRGRDRTGFIESSLRFQEAKEIYPLVDALARVSRRDADINKQYPRDPFGATLEAAERLGIIKP